MLSRLACVIFGLDHKLLKSGIGSEENLPVRSLFILLVTLLFGLYCAWSMAEAATTYYTVSKESGTTPFTISVKTIDYALPIKVTIMLITFIVIIVWYRELFRLVFIRSEKFNKLTTFLTSLFFAFLFALLSATALSLGFFESAIGQQMKSTYIISNAKAVNDFSIGTLEPVTTVHPITLLPEKVKALEILIRESNNILFQSGANFFFLISLFIYLLMPMILTIANPVMYSLKSARLRL